MNSNKKTILFISYLDNDAEFIKKSINEAEANNFVQFQSRLTHSHVHIVITKWIKDMMLESTTKKNH